MALLLLFAFLMAPGCLFSSQNILKVQVKVSFETQDQFLAAGLCKNQEQVMYTQSTVAKSGHSHSKRKEY